MRLANVLIADQKLSNALFQTMTGPLAPLACVLEAIRHTIRQATDDILFEDRLTHYSIDENRSIHTRLPIAAWLEDTLTTLCGYRPPFIIGRIPIVGANGLLNDDVHDLNVFVGKPLSLADAINIQAEDAHDPQPLRNRLPQDPFALKTTPWIHVSAAHYDKRCPNTINYPVLLTDLAEVIDEVLTALDPQTYHPSATMIEGRSRHLSTSRLADVIAALNEWHLSLSYAQQNKIGLSSISSRVIALNTIAASCVEHNAFEYSKRDHDWKRDFRIITQRDGETRLPLPIGGFLRLNQRRLWTLMGWIRFIRPADLVDGPLKFGRNHDYAKAAHAYAKHVDGEYWTAGRRPDTDLRPVRPIHWAHVTEVGNVPMNTAGAVILGLESNILETIIVLEEPAAIITERWAIVSGEVPASIAASLIGQPITTLIEHPLLEPIPEDSCVQMTIKSVGPLIEESAYQNHNQAHADRLAWEALKQYFSLAKLDDPAWLTAMGSSNNKRTRTPVPGCTLIRFDSRPLLGDSPYGSIDIRQQEAATLKRTMDFKNAR